MDNNTLAKYLGKDLKKIINDLQVVQGTAKDSGNIYYAIEITFINGYKKRLFLRADEQFAWVNAFDMLDAQATIDKNFE